MSAFFLPLPALSSSDKKGKDESTGPRKGVHTNSNPNSWEVEAQNSRLMDRWLQRQFQTHTPK